MKQAQGGCQLRVPQVRIKCIQLLGHHQRLVHKQTCRQAAYIKAVMTLLLQTALSMAASLIQMQLRGTACQGLRNMYKQLLYMRQGLQCPLTTCSRVHRHRTPARYLQTLLLQGLLQECALPEGSLGIRRQEHRTRSKTSLERYAMHRCLPAQKGLGKCQQQTATITGKTIRRYRTTMRKAAERLNGSAHQRVARLPVQLCQ